MRAVSHLVSHVRGRLKRVASWLSRDTSRHAATLSEVEALHRDLTALLQVLDHMEQARKVAELALVAVRDELEVAVTAVWHDNERNACGVGGWAVHAHAIERALETARTVVGDA